MSHIKDRLIQLKNEVENTGNGAYFSKNNISKIVELLLADLEQDEKENGWIPVSERLPEKNKDVITTVKYSGFMGMYGRWLKTAFIDDYGEWNGECIGGEVIAWMPLPEPYKED